MKAMGTMENSRILLMTVGTGTAGKTSRLEEGLVNTLRQVKPRAYWLLPSADPASLSVADYVREACPNGFQSAGPDELYLYVSQPDDLFACRAAARTTIRAMRAGLRPGERLIVNPTSGTKQMSAGAVLAALDEGVGDIQFIAGERADGVVITGCEKVVAFDTAAFFRERALREADALYRAGAFKAAADLLQRADADVFRRESALCRCLHEWHRLNYAVAAGLAATVAEPMRRRLMDLAGDVENGRLTEAVLADLIGGADDLRRWDEHEEAAARYYKAVEYAARLRLALAIGHPPPFGIEQLRALPIDRQTHAQLRENPDKTCTPGLQLTMRLLQATGDDLSAAFLNNHALNKALARRNWTVHEIRPVSAAESQSLCDLMRNLLRPCFPAACAADARNLRPADLLGEQKTENGRRNTE